MNVIQTVKELFEPTFEAIGDSELKYELKRELLYNLYCFACAVYPGYVAAPCKTLFEYGCCFLIEPERHPDYDKNDPEFTRTAASSDVLSGGGRWYSRRGKDFIKYDFGSALFERMLNAGVIPPQDRAPIAALSLYKAVYLCANMFKKLRPLWYTYYFYLDATNEEPDEEYDGKLWELLHTEPVYRDAMYVKGSMLIGDEAELGAGKLCDFYMPFIQYRRTHIFDVFEQKMQSDVDFVAEYSGEMLKLYPENTSLMNWNAAARSETVARDRDEKALAELIIDLRDYTTHASSPVLDKYLKLAELMQKQLKSGGQ